VTNEQKIWYEVKVGFLPFPASFLTLLGPSALILKVSGLILFILIHMIAENLGRIRQRIAQACVRSGRDTSGVTLVAVAKTFSADLVAEALRAGALDIGENYVQELAAKREALAAQPVRWHFIGHLQRNKAKVVVPWVEMIHAVDSMPLAREIETRARASGRTVDILIEVNTTGEPSKFGVPPDGLLPAVSGLAGLTGIRIAGLMTIGPFLPDPEGSRPMFQQLRSLRDQAAALGQANAPMHHLSMGMTGDFEVAIEEGATLVRIGTAIFGSRRKPA
jgi:pyridoxal phosphate enzyme (YggS family)